MFAAATMLLTANARSGLKDLLTEVLALELLEERMLGSSSDADCGTRIADKISSAAKGACEIDADCVYVHTLNTVTFGWDKECRATTGADCENNVGEQCGTGSDWWYPASDFQGQTCCPSGSTCAELTDTTYPQYPAKYKKTCQAYGTATCVAWAGDCDAKYGIASRYGRYGSSQARCLSEKDANGVLAAAACSKCKKCED